MAEPAKKSRSKWWYLLLAVQFPGLLIVPFFNRIEPAWMGIPFFYWYQTMWILLGAAFTLTVYFMLEHNK